MDSCNSKDFKLLTILGKTKLSTVYKALNKNKKYLAIKIIDLKRLDLKTDELIMREVNIWSQLQHPNIVAYYGSFIHKTFVWIKSEYMNVNSIRHLLENKYKTGLKYEYILAITKDVLIALMYLHSNNIIHRDIKAANILLNSNKEIKVADFGVSRLIKGKVSTFTGTPLWMAPEVLQNEIYDIKADIWSLGITVIEMKTAKPPHAELKPLKAMIKIITQPAPSVKGNLKTLLKMMLIKDATKRYTAERLLKSNIIKKARLFKELEEL